MMHSAIAPRANLASALAILATGSTLIERKNTSPLLSNAAFVAGLDGSLSVVGTDLDITAAIVVAGGVADAGFATSLPAHVLHGLLKANSDGDLAAFDYDSSGDGTVVAIEMGGTKYNLDSIALGSEAGLFSTDVQGEIHAEFSLSSSALLEALETVQFAISTEETRYYLNGVFMHVVQKSADGASLLRFVATDGHRLARFEIPAPEGVPSDMKGIIIPRKTVAFLIRMAKRKDVAETVEIVVNTVKARFQFGEVSALTKLVDGTFPDYQRVIPSNNDRILTVNRKDMIAAVKNVGLIASERGRSVKLCLSAGLLRLVVNNPATGNASAELPVSYDAPTLEIGFNSSYLLDILATVEGELVEFCLSDPGAPTLVRAPGDEVAAFVLMPMRV